MRKMPMAGVRVWLKALGMHADEAGGSSRSKKKKTKKGVTSKSGQECRERGERSRTQWDDMKWGRSVVQGWMYEAKVEAGAGQSAGEHHQHIFLSHSGPDNSCLHTLGSPSQTSTPSPGNCFRMLMMSKTKQKQICCNSIQNSGLMTRLYSSRPLNQQWPWETAILARKNE